VLLAGIAAEAGNVYNYNNNPKPFNIFVDEGAEVLNQPLIQIANKGGGSMFRLFLATQTYADIAVRLGSKDRALQVIGNMNNVIALRIKDSDTQKTISDSFGKAAMRRMNMTYGHGVSPAPHDMSQGNYGESLVPTEAELFPPDLFSGLPPLHFMAMFAGGKIMKCRVPLIKD
jgi:conjugal transfer pilus assembly protein TraD